MAYIFNRNSLHECLLNPRSFRDSQSGASVPCKNVSGGSSSYASFMKKANINLLAGNSVGGTSNSSSGSNNSRASGAQSNLMKKQVCGNFRNQRPNNLPLGYFKKETSI